MPYVTPNDFAATTTDLSSKPKDINNKGQVVGYIETTYDKENRDQRRASYMKSQQVSSVTLITC